MCVFYAPLFFQVAVAHAIFDANRRFVKNYPTNLFCTTIALRNSEPPTLAKLAQLVLQLYALIETSTIY